MNRLILVTGGNSGIGKEIVQNQISIGNNVISTYNKSGETTFKIEREDQLVRQIRVDIRNEDEIKQLLQMIKAEFGKLDGLVNNAGMAYGNLTSLSPLDEIREVFEINFFAQVNLIQRAIRIMRKGNNSSIVNIGSIAALRKDIGSMAYSSSKAALIQATRVMAQEYIGYGVRLNSIAPGITKTKMLDLMDTRSVDKQVSDSGIKRIANAKEIANVVGFLLSSESSYIIGQCINVDGGQI